MHERHTNKLKYFNEQVYTTEKYVIPFINRARPIDSSLKVLEIGCGEGGNLKPFLDLGCEVTGIDISGSKIENAVKFYLEHPNSGKATFIAKDIYLAENELEQYDLVIMRDVIEHIHDQERFMGFAKKFLKTDGIFFIAFPPWYNPFGGHQQVAESRILSKLPYYHLLPAPVYRLILKAGGETREKIEGFLEIKETGISIERFEKILRKNGYLLIIKKLFLFNPNYEIKFNIKPKEQGRIIASIPFLKNFATTAIYYLVKKN